MDLSAYYFMMAIVFVFGLCIGSFMNVCIHRIPIQQSIIHPGSRCPICGTPIHPTDNVPLIGYLRLKGKCRSCGAKISLRYPTVELITGLLAVAVFIKFGISAQWAVYFTFAAALFTLSLIDLDHYILPNVITLPGIPLCFIGSFFLPAVTVKDAIIGILAGGGSLWMVGFVYQKIAGKEGMGGGDVKLLAMIGALLGWKGVLFTIFFGSALGTLVGIAVMLPKGGMMKRKIPFGPFLSLGAVGYIFFGPQIISWYLGMLH
jgi:leader peptidase (prepilin peptidase) / N-methyltransferase